MLQAYYNTINFTKFRLNKTQYSIHNPKGTKYYTSSTSTKMLNSTTKVYIAFDNPTPLVNSYNTGNSLEGMNL